MKITDILKSSTKPIVSFEITPVDKGASIKSLEPTLESLASFNPPFIDVTSRAEELKKVKSADGLKAVPYRKRVGTGMICAKVQFQYGIPAVPHVLCNGFTCEETEDFLVELNYAGIENVLALRGDPLSHNKFVPDYRSVNHTALDLVEQIVDLNRGSYLRSEQGHPTDFCIGVGAYPEKHYDAESLDEDIAWLKRKVDSGASYAVTQMFFDNKRFYHFVDKCRDFGIDIPIIPGLKIFTRRSQLKTLPKVFNLSFPYKFKEEFIKVKKGGVLDFGVDWARRQIEDLFSHPEYFNERPIAHIYVLGSSKPVEKLMSRLSI
ncbi:methylenetetrahydrofolate reductase [NAD(P)H] [Candidatus Woesearchaeota archaeon]|nr:MAG: methylenetetrahydrofolate reductase [NAD(P)H] [Candidatus Woesearchaeota archaeon]